METIEEEHALANRTSSTQTLEPEAHPMSEADKTTGLKEVGLIDLESDEETKNELQTMLLGDNRAVLSNSVTQTDPMKPPRRLKAPRLPKILRATEKYGRDPKLINHHVTIEFYDIISESTQQAQTNKSIWSYSLQSYKLCTNVLYKCLGLLLSLPLSIFWSIIFAILSYLNTWICIPSLKVNTIIMNWIRLVWLSWIDACMAPFWVHFDRFLLSTKRKPPN